MNTAQETRFTDCIAYALRAAQPEFRETDFNAPDALAFLDYKTELAVKTDAVRRLWTVESLPGSVPAVIPSPMPRFYRTTSKRRAVYGRGRFRLEMGYSHHGGGTGDTLEAELHSVIYARLSVLLRSPKYDEIAKSLNYCILRGSYTEAALILNVFRVSGDVVRKCKFLGEELRKAVPGLISMFLLLDESKSDYYLEASARSGKNRLFKKFFGPENLVQKFHGMKLFYPPDAFSQVNASLCETFAGTAVDLLSPNPESRVIDLYCGYGLLTMAAAEKAKSVVGMDWEGPAVRAAAGNAAHLFPEKDIRFAACAITGESLKERLPPPAKKELVILDPPRSGAAPAVLEAVAARRPERILHIFCGADTIPFALRHWKANAYSVRDVRILDMFPGSANVETLVLLAR